MKDIEYLSLYLPYNLKCQVEWQTRRGAKSSKRIILLTKSNISYAQNWKPLLYPLSMLTEEIEHQGERFVPIDKLRKFATAADWIRQLEDEYRFIDYFIERQNLKVMSWIHFQKLIEWHFDVFGLLDKNLAINKELWKSGKI